MQSANLDCEFSSTMVQPTEPLVIPCNCGHSVELPTDLTPLDKRMLSCGGCFREYGRAAVIRAVVIRARYSPSASSDQSGSVAPVQPAEKR